MKTKTNIQKWLKIFKISLGSGCNKRIQTINCKKLFAHEILKDNTQRKIRGWY